MNSIHLDALVFQGVLSYTFSCWEEPIDCIKHHARQAFDSLISIHLAASSEDPRASKFLLGLLNNLIGKMMVELLSTVLGFSIDSFILML